MAGQIGGDCRSAPLHSPPAFNKRLEPAIIMDCTAPFSHAAEHHHESIEPVYCHRGPDCDP
jgi:hypothetical protein